MESETTKKSCMEEASSRVEETKSKASDYFKSGLCKRNQALSCSNGCDVGPLSISAFSGTNVHNEDVNVLIVSGNTGHNSPIVGANKSNTSNTSFIFH